MLAIEGNHQNQINVTIDQREEDFQAENHNIVTNIVDEYKRLALYDIFKEIVSKLINEDMVMQ